ncbi:MAG: response regulator [Pseudomonadota bacterium]
MNFLRTLKLSHRLAALIAIFSLGFVTYGIWSFQTLNALKVNGPVYREIVAGKDIIADTLPPPLYIIESYLVVLQMTASGDAAERAALVRRLSVLRAEHATRYRHWLGQALNKELADLLLRQANEPALAFYDTAFNQLIPAMERGDQASTTRALALLKTRYFEHRAVIDKLIERARTELREDELAASARIASDSLRLLLTLLVSLGVGVAGAALIARSITGPLDEAVGVARRVAAGKLDGRIANAYHDEPGQLLDALAVMTGSLATMLAARNASELSLRQAKELTERLIDSANVMIVGLDRAGAVLIFNGAAEALTGYRRSEVLGKTWRELPIVAGQDGARWPGPEQWGQVAHSFEQDIVDSGGAKRTISWQHTVMGAEGDKVALLSFGIDVSEQIAAQRDAVAAREQAEAASRSKSEFLANMSHEIRTPMNAIIGMTGLALRTELDARQRNYMEKVEHAAHGLLGIINDILDFSKIEAGQLQFEKRPLLLRHTLEHLATLSVIKAQEKGLELLFDVAPDVPAELVGDPLRLAQVLLNLVNNAIKFTHKGEVVVAVRLEERSASQACLRFEVRDTGIGIDPAQSARLFEAFAQADASTTRNYGGTGLGLSISRRLVELMEGRLWVDSKPGEGSVFSFTGRFDLPPNAMRAVATVATVLPMRVLVVDDNAAAREILLGILASMRLDAHACADGASAIAELEAGERRGAPYNVVLMDWMMPTLDGAETIRRIRASPQISATLAIIMVTAYSRDDLIASTTDIEQIGVLEKPVTPSSVLDALASYAGMLGATSKRRVHAGAYHEALLHIRAARVLLVEDNDINEELAVDILDGMGLKVSVAHNGREAVDMVGTGGYDVVLMDCQMPVMDGYEATGILRRDPRHAHMPIVAMTANAMAGDREKCIAAGMSDHISKPIDVQTLATILAKVLPSPEERGVAPQAAQDDSTLRAAGIDPDMGLARQHGSLARYRDLLGQFRERQGGAMAALREAMEGGETVLARRLAHNVAGMAANLGAPALADVARAVEQGIEAGMVEPGLMEEMEASVTALLDAIGQYLAR